MARHCRNNKTPRPTTRYSAADHPVSNAACQATGPAAQEAT